jgi:Tol biopolymer transport system component
MIGQTISHYRILEKLGGGAMGAVYRAQDTKLGRQVAIKILTAELPADPERLRRFEQEARAASALDHPNIVTLFDVSEKGDQPFIVMQLVEGATLGQLMKRGRLDVKSALDYAIQIADGLARAHGRGIVHRDLKPDNVMVTDDGLVKILDFGLAKLTEPLGISETSTLDRRQPPTEAGRIVGTAAYMSPEQARGGGVDARSDVFSLGAVLYEMLTGRPPFDGDSVPELLTAILREEPERLSALAPFVPIQLEMVVSRALRKEPERRFQSMADVRVELREIRDALESGSFVSAARFRQAEAPSPGRRRRWLWWVPPLMVAGGLVAAWLLRSHPEDRGGPPTTSPLTTYVGWESEPALSPDGSLVAFVWDEGRGGVPRLYVQLVGSPESLPLTTGPGDARHPAWSPDGLEMAFLRHTPEGSQDIVAVPALGGAERWLGRTGVAHFGGLDWSPRGDLLAVVDRESPEASESIFLLSIETGEKRQLSRPPAGGFGDRSPVFSPDGRSLAFVRWRETPVSEIFIQPVDGEATRLCLHRGHVRDLDWLPDGSALVFSALSEGTYGLWKVSLDRGEPTRLPFGENANGVSLSATGDRLVYSRIFADTNIWRVSGPASEKREAPDRLVASTRNEWSPSFSPDGSRIALASDRSGPVRIWLCGSEGKDCSQLSAAVNGTTPVWSPSGEQIAFSGGEEGGSHVYVVNLKGEFVRRLTEGVSTNVASSWSPDGQWVYFASDRTGRYEIWKARPGGEEDRQVTRTGGIFAHQCEDGFLYYVKPTSPTGIWRMPSEGGEESLVLERQLWLPSFTVWRQVLLYIPERADRTVSIESHDLVRGESHTLLEPSPGALVGKYGRIHVSPDGRWILYPQEDGKGSDLMLVEGLP